MCSTVREILQKIVSLNILCSSDNIDNLVFFIVKGSVKLFSKRGYPFVKYEQGDMFGDCDSLLDVSFLTIRFIYSFSYPESLKLSH